MSTWARVLTGLIIVAGIECMTRTNVMAQTAPCTSGVAQDALPSNIVVVPHLQPVVRRLLAQSDTFRRQCTRVAAAPLVRIDIQVLMGVHSSFTRARGRIRRMTDGRIEASIDIPICRDAPELVVHEMEHVLEQMDGLNLPLLAQTRNTTVRQGADGAFETERARRAGEAAAEELRASSDAGAGHAAPRRSWLG